jgi:hypothetical protein
MESAMTQAELDGIFATIRARHLVEGWSANHTGVMDVLRRTDPSAMWVRFPFNGRWIEIPQIRIAAHA